MNTDNEDDKAKPASPQGMGMNSFFTDMGRILSLKLQWEGRTTLEKAYTATFVVMLIGLLPVPYSFYDSLRLIVCICLYFFLQVILPQREDHKRWFAVIIALLVLYNPIIPIHFGVQPVWTILNIITLWVLFKARMIFDESEG